MIEVKFLAIGDVTTDSFIKLSENDSEILENKICVPAGAKIPYENLEVLYGVGNAANAAVCCSRLEIKSALLTNLGDDENGKKALENWQKENIETSLVKINKDKKTNHHFVLRKGATRTILIKHEHYDYDFNFENIKTDWIYLTSMAENSIDFHRKIAQIVKEKKIKLAFQPGTFQIRTEFDELKEVYENTEIFFANKEEFQEILKTDTKDIKTLILKMAELGPRKIVLTDGRNGIFGFDGEKLYNVPIYPDPKPPTDRTGAGDATSSTIVAMLIRGKSFKEALLYGPVNSMSVVQFTGAQAGLLSTNEIEKYLRKAPENYRITIE